MIKYQMSATESVAKNRATGSEGFIKISFQQYYSVPGNPANSDVTFEAKIHQDASLVELKEYIMDGLRAMGYCFDSEDF